MYCEIFTQGTPQYSNVVHAVLSSLLFMSACMTWMQVPLTCRDDPVRLTGGSDPRTNSLLTSQNMCITLKIQLLHLKSDSIIFKSSEGLALPSMQMSDRKKLC